MEEATKIKKRNIVIVSIVVPVALLHFVTGKHYHGPFPGFVNGYLIDILLPFALYFLLCNVRQLAFLNSWVVKCVLVFAIGFGVETAQYFGVPIFGQTFDPLDYVMYAGGVLLAAFIEQNVFPRIFSFWEPGDISREKRDF